MNILKQMFSENQKLHSNFRIQALCEKKPNIIFHCIASHLSKILNMV